jgi:hypothetical protein
MGGVNFLGGCGLHWWLALVEWRAWMPTSKSNVLIVAQPILLMSLHARIANNPE